ncbi:hypothetical protein [Streptomyces sp. NPDC057580]|uniref:hypothetical protein n=1 Tax=Streptomyces sp. NPDC057580 TaxID=3346173 RepID=UPI00368FACA3
MIKNRTARIGITLLLAAGALGVTGLPAAADTAPSGAKETRTAAGTSQADSSLAAVPATALADVWVDTGIETKDSSDDAGGVDIFGYIRSTTGGGYYYRYTAVFNAYDEKLRVRDEFADGHEAVVDMKFYNRSGDLVDTDQFVCGNDCTYNLGTPDGSGDVPEGYRVAMKLSAGGDTTGWETHGKA